MSFKDEQVIELTLKESARRFHPWISPHPSCYIQGPTTLLDVCHLNIGEERVKLLHNF